MGNQLFSFRNNFDDVTVGLDDDSPVVDGQMTDKGPFVVSVEFDAPEIGGENKRWSFDKLSDARAKFLELVGNEIDAVLSQNE